MKGFHLFFEGTWPSQQAHLPFMHRPFPAQLFGQRGMLHAGPIFDSSAQTSGTHTQSSPVRQITTYEGLPRINKMFFLFLSAERTTSLQSAPMKPTLQTHFPSKQRPFPWQSFAQACSVTWCSRLGLGTTFRVFSARVRGG